jgi:hypothetical protein
MTQVDLRLVMQWFEEGEFNVRNSALRLLAMFSRDVNATNFLKSVDVKNLAVEETLLYMNALGGVKVLKADCAEIAGNEFLRLTGETSVLSKDNLQRISACMEALQRLEQNANDRVVSRLKSIVADYRFTDKVRCDALAAFPAAAIPTPSAIDFIIAYINEDNPKLESSLVQVPSTFARKCRQDVDYVLSCVQHLPTLERATVALHRSISARPVTGENEMKVSELRVGVSSIRSIVSAFNEYLARPVAKLA